MRSRWFSLTLLTFLTLATNAQTLTYARFLEQATFGPTPQSLAYVQQVGLEAFLDDQFSRAESPLPPLNPNDRNALLNAFVGNAAQGEDQLRQRMINALSEIIVISTNKNQQNQQIVPWLAILSRNAFGNYRTLLYEISTDASMGMYLDMVNSARPTAEGGANENYAREVMQLFTIGLHQLNQDGTPVLDTSGNLIPTYTQTDVAQVALAFTGWTYNTSSNPPSATLRNFGYYPGPMIPAPAYHETSSKTVLGTVIPANQTVQQDMSSVLDILFNHPNLGPFLATRLIRALVTSNPSPAYVARISAVFADNGQGVRGDLRAVVRAILLDAEARNDNPAGAFGRLRTPMQHVIAMCRALGLTVPAGSTINWNLGQMGEHPLMAPSVFGHYSALFRIPNSGGLYGPEFQIHTPMEAINRANLLHAQWTTPTGTLPAALQPLADISADPVALTNAVDAALLYGRMPTAMRTAIEQAVAQSATNPMKVRTALYLTIMSGDYLVQH